MAIETLLTLIIISNKSFSLNTSQVLTIKPSILVTQNSFAEVSEVQATGQANNYTLAVTVSSPDTGCDSYADWWEVITPEGELLYRRVLLHSHVDEQPFRRTRGLVSIQPQQQIIVRVHMSDSGYSPLAQQGTVKSGFTAVRLPENFATNLESVEPLPQGCAY